MPKFEVHIPSSETQEFNVTFRVSAATWMAALKLGMQKLGESGAGVSNLLVDVQEDDSVHVTEPQSGRVFRIRELSEQEAQSARVKSAPGVPAVQPRAGREDRTELDMPAVVPPPGLFEAPTLPPPLQKASPAPAPPRAPAPAPRPAAAAPLARPAARPAPARRSPSTEMSEVVELEQPVRPVVGKIGRERERTPARQSGIEDVLADVFERVQEAQGRPVQEALYYLLDLAMEKIAVDSATVWRADGVSGDLTFWAVRGPKAEELMRSKMVVPAGTGIAGFCAMEGVSVGISDVQKDPRYYAAISARVNYETRSVLCSPMMTHGRTFGCFQLLNKKGSHVFTAHEMGILSYISHQAALYLNRQS